MAMFACASCGYEGHFSEFSAGTHVEMDDDIGEEIEVDDVECPECQSSSVVET